MPLNRRDAELLLKQVESLIEEVRAGQYAAGSEPMIRAIDSDALRQETLDYLGRAREVYRLKLSGAE